MSDKKITISVIWWWSGTFNVLYWLKKVFSEDKANLNAIIWMTDSWWTTWLLRDKYGILPTWDLRRWIAALAEDTWLIRKLFEYKFSDEEWVIGWNKIWNILLTALADIKWNFEDWLLEACKMFNVKWQVIPVTLEDVHLWVKFEDWTEVIWEKNIDVSLVNPEKKAHNINQNITEAFLVWWCGEINPRAKKAILDSDFIIIWPGSFYTSIVTNFICKWFKETVKESKAKKIYICNIMSDIGETTTYDLKDYINNMERYSGEILDYILVNDWFISEELVEKYKNEEWKKPVKKKQDQDFSWKSYKIIESDFVNESDIVRHDPVKLAKVIGDVINLESSRE